MLALLSRVGRAAVEPFRWYHRRLAEHPLAVKTVTTGGVLSTDDILSQWLRSPLAQDSGATPNSSPTGRSACDGGISPSKTLGWWNAQQTMWMGVYGIFFVAPFCHVWYQVLPL